MKTAEIIDKYRKILCPILKCEESELRFFIGNRTYTNVKELIKNSQTDLSFSDLSYVKEIKEVEYFQSEKDKNDELTGNQIRYTTWTNWAERKFTIICKDKVVGTFELYKMPHCCAILVSCKAYVALEFRNKRIGTILNQLRQDIGRFLGYSLLMCTDIAQNKHQRQLLETNGWKDIFDVVNKRTKNRVFLSVINL